MDFNRLAAIFRAIRISRGWRQADVAARAGVTRQAVSRLERGRLDQLSLRDLLNVAEALDIQLRLSASWRGGDLDRLLNARHSALHEALARFFGSFPGWIVAPEVSYSRFGERGVMDILAWHEATGTLLVIELKTEVVDINRLVGGMDVKRRLAPEVAAERGWHARRVAAWVVIADSSTNRRRVGSHRTMLRAAFPLDGRSIRSWLEDPSTAVAALSFWSNAQQPHLNRRLATVKRVRRRPAAAA